MRSVTTRKFFCWGCYSRHNSGAGCNFGCWNRRHSFLHTVLLSAAQFGSGFWGLVLLSSAQFAKNAVVIYSTVCRGKRQDFCKIYCYPAHNSEKFTGFLGLLSAAHFCCRAKIMVVMYGTFPKILPTFPLLLFAAHFLGGGCYSAHSSQNPPNRHRTILAQKIIFSGCYARHIVALRTKQLLFTAHRSWNPRHISVVIFDTATHYF